MRPGSNRRQVVSEVASSADNRPATCGCPSSTVRVSRTPRSTSSGQGGSDTLLDPESDSGSRLAERSTPSIVEAAHRRRRVVYRKDDALRAMSTRIRSPDAGRAVASVRRRPRSPARSNAVDAALGITPTSRAIP